MQAVSHCVELACILHLWTSLPKWQECILIILTIERSPPNFPKHPLQAVQPLWDPRISGVCGCPASNLWVRDQAQAVCLWAHKWAPLESQSLGSFLILCHSTVRDQKMKNIKKMGPILTANFYMQMYLYIFTYTYMKSMFSLWTFLSKARHHLLEMFLTLQLF